MMFKNYESKEVEASADARYERHLALQNRSMVAEADAEEAIAVEQEIPWCEQMEDALFKREDDEYAKFVEDAAQDAENAYEREIDRAYVEDSEYGANEEEYQEKQDRAEMEEFDERIASVCDYLMGGEREETKSQGLSAASYYKKKEGEDV